MIPWSSRDSQFFYLDIVIPALAFCFLNNTFPITPQLYFDILNEMHKSCRFIMQLSWLLSKQNMEIPEGWKKFFYVTVKKSKIWNAKLKKKEEKEIGKRQN